MRNLTKTLAVVSFLVPASAYPLGIGEIKLHSALNQNVDAEIELFLSAGEKASDIKVNLASPDKFDETGIPWSYFLSKLRFQTIESNGKRIVIKVTSREVLKEPFLDFLMQVSWPKGDLFREFTVLVDPPSEYVQASTPVYRAADSFESYQPKPSIKAPSSAPRPEIPQKPRIRVNASAGGGTYGPTTKHDTLWKIAQSVSQSTGVSLEQAIIALYDANQNAFYKANVNALLVGKTLKIPSNEAILKLPKSEASYEFNRQMQAWASPSSVPRLEKHPEGEDALDNQLTLSAPSQDVVRENATVAGNSQTSTAKTIEPVPLPSSNATKQQSVANDVITAKITALEKQLATMQELIALKDQQLAALQNQSQPKVPVNLIPKSPAVPGSGQTASPALTPSQSIQPQVSQPTSGDLTSNKEPPAVQAPSKPVAPPPVRRVSAPEADDSFSWSYFGATIFGVGLLGLLAWYWQQKRKDEYVGSFELSSNANKSKPNEFLADQAQYEENQAAEAGSSDNLFVSDFNSGEFDVFDMDQAEIDPISEADVYLAYGRYQQAEDLMRHAIEEQPVRDDFKLKLLEIFYANENKEAFEKYTTELIDEGKIDDGVFWAKVTEMGTEICPDSIFFSSKSVEPLDLKKDVVGLGQPSVNDEGQAKLDEMDFDLASFEELFYNEDSSNPADRMFDIEFEKPVTVNLSNRQDSLDTPDDNQGIDFELNSLKFDKPTLSSIENNSSRTSTADVSSLPKDASFESLDFSFDLSDFGLDKPADDKISPTESDNGFASLEFDFSDISADIGGKNSAIMTEELVPSALKSESFPAIEIQDSSPSQPDLYRDNSLSIDIDFNDPTLGFSEEQRLENFGIVNLSNMDQIDTKLDLAMAYIEMGDKEAAIEIAQEVFEKGTLQQKNMAKAILENKQ